MRTRIALSLLLTLSSLAAAQRPVIGIDRGANELFTSNHADFYGSAVPIGPTTGSIMAMDYDATGSTLWGVLGNTVAAQYGVFDHGTGAWVPLGPVTGLSGPGGWVADITASPNGVDWYLAVSPLGPGHSYLYRGDVTTGTFAYVGEIASGDFSGLAMSSSGALYGYRVYTDRLYGIDTTTGEGFPVTTGSGQQSSNGNVGLDFDWGNDTLYATISNSLESRLVTLGLLGGSYVLDEVAGFRPMELAIAAPGPGAVGSSFGCPTNPNSTGVIAGVSAVGSPYALSNRLELRVANLPPGQFGYFLASDTFTIAAPPGSAGTLCLGGTIARFNAPAQIVVGPFGALDVDLHAIPTTPPTAVQPGDVWYFQCWHRDMGTSNFSSLLRVDFL